MLSLTHNDYFTTSGTGKSWQVHIKQCTNKIVQDYHGECVRSAKLIYENATSPIVLLYSGGLDSEFMLNIFRTAKVPFKVAIISYGNYNVHDTKFAYDYCSANNIDPIIIDIDMNNFISSGKIYDIADSVKCCAYQMPSVMYGISKLDGTVIMANGEPYLKNYEGKWIYQETERVNTYMRWYTNQGITGTPDFLRYTAETTLSFLLEDRVKELVTNKHPGKLSTRTSKHFIYSKNYNFVPRPKYTGWEEIEKISPIIDEIQSNFKLLKETNNGVYEESYNSLVKRLAN